MTYKRKSNYACKSKVECLECGKVILSENQTRHLNITHKGLKNIKFRFHNDAKQPRLQFSLPKKDINCNITLGEQDNTEAVDDLVDDDDEESNTQEENQEEVEVISDTEQADDLGNESDQEEESSSEEESNGPVFTARFKFPNAANIRRIQS